MEDRYYEEYLMSHSHARKMQAFQKQQAAAFLKHLSLDRPRVFEAGCGDGQFSLLLKESGCDVLANEPSAKAREACSAKGLRTIGGYLSSGAFGDLAGSFDAVFARQVLEHVPDPNDFLKGFRSLLRPEGVALIEVPALEQAIENDRFFDFFPDHLSYFSAHSLRHLCLRNLFEVLRLERAMDGEYHEIWLRRLEPPNLDKIRSAKDTIATAFREFLDSESRAGRRVAIWGAGGKGVLSLSLVDVSAVAYLVDLDPVKHGRHLPVSHLQVWPPEKLAQDPVDTVLITALAYKDEIASDLRGARAFKGRISCLSGGSIIEIDPDRRSPDSISGGL